MCNKEIIQASKDMPLRTMMFHYNLALYLQEILIMTVNMTPLDRTLFSSQNEIKLRGTTTGSAVL